MPFAPGLSIDLMLTFFPAQNPPTRLAMLIFPPKIFNFAFYSKVYENCLPRRPSLARLRQIVHMPVASDTFPHKMHLRHTLWRFNMGSEKRISHKNVQVGFTIATIDPMPKRASQCTFPPILGYADMRIAPLLPRLASTGCRGN